jgi:hypothetical protein
VASARRNEATAFVRTNSLLAASAPKILERVKRSRTPHCLTQNVTGHFSLMTGRAHRIGSVASMAGKIGMSAASSAKEIVMTNVIVVIGPDQLVRQSHSGLAQISTSCWVT